MVARAALDAFVFATGIAVGSQCVAGDFDLTGLPSYRPEQQVSGAIRNFGFGLGGVLKLREDGFREIHPGIRVDDNLPTSDAAIPALVTGVTGGLAMPKWKGSQ